MQAGTDEFWDAKNIFHFIYLSTGLWLVMWTGVFQARLMQINVKFVRFPSFSEADRCKTFKISNKYLMNG